jgi:hypothetical protein
MRNTLIVKILHLDTLKQDVQPDTHAFYLKFNAHPHKKKKKEKKKKKKKKSISLSKTKKKKMFREKF